MSQQARAAKTPNSLRRHRRRRVRRWFAAALLVIALVHAADYWWFPYGRLITAPSANRGENGLWLEHTWYFGRHSDADVARLARRLRDQQIRYAYFHVGFVEPNGALRSRFCAPARRLIAALHRRAPGVKILAWVLAGNPASGMGRVNLAGPGVRPAMVQSARWLVAACGFDGVHWDYEQCLDGDADFLALLDETRAVLPPGAHLSAAVPMWVPPGVRRVVGWSEDYAARVAARLDDMAVMCYDSTIYQPRAYVWLVHEQAARMTRAAHRGNPRCRVLLGIPAYPGTWSHHPRAENLSNALRGVRQGLADSRARPETFAGVAVFADYTQTPADQRVYHDMWLRP